MQSTPTQTKCAYWYKCKGQVYDCSGDLCTEMHAVNCNPCGLRWLTCKARLFLVMLFHHTWLTCRYVFNLEFVQLFLKLSSANLNQTQRVPFLFVAKAQWQLDCSWLPASKEAYYSRIGVPPCTLIRVCNCSPRPQETRGGVHRRGCSMPRMQVGSIFEPSSLGCQSLASQSIQEETPTTRL